MSALDDLRAINDALPSVRLIRGDAVALEPVRWAWKGYLPLARLRQDHHCAIAGRDDDARRHLAGRVALHRRR